MSLDSSFSSETNNTQIIHLLLIIVGNIGLILLDPLYSSEERSYVPTDPTIYKQLQWALHNWVSQQALPVFLSFLVASIRSLYQRFNFHSSVAQSHLKYVINDSAENGHPVTRNVRTLLRDLVLCEPSDDAAANSLPLSPPDAVFDDQMKMLLTTMMDILIDTLPDLTFCAQRGIKEQLYRDEDNSEKYKTTFERIQTLFRKLLTHSSRLAYLHRLKQNKQRSRSSKDEETFSSHIAIHRPQERSQPLFRNHIQTLIGLVHISILYTTHFSDQNFNFTKLAAGIRSSLMSHPTILHTVSAVCMPSLLEATSVCVIDSSKTWANINTVQRELDESSRVELRIPIVNFPRTSPGLNFFLALFLPSDAPLSIVFVQNMIQCAIPFLASKDEKSRVWVGVLFLFNELLCSGHSKLFEPFLRDLLELVTPNLVHDRREVKWVGITTFVVNLLFVLHRNVRIETVTSKRDERTYFHSWMEQDFVWRNDFDSQFRYSIIHSEEDISNMLRLASLILSQLSRLTQTSSSMILLERNLLTCLLLLLPVPNSILIRLVVHYLWPISFSLAQSYVVSSNNTQHPANVMYHTPSFILLQRPMDPKSHLSTLFPTATQVAHLSIVLSGEYLNLILTSLPSTVLNSIISTCDADLVQSVFIRSRSNINFLTLFGKLGEIGTAPQTVVPEFPSMITRLSTDTVSGSETLSLYLVMEYTRCTDSIKLDEQLDRLTDASAKQVDVGEFKGMEPSSQGPLAGSETLQRDYADSLNSDPLLTPTTISTRIIGEESGSRPMRILLPIGDGIKTAQSILAGLTQENLQHVERDRTVDTLSSDNIVSEAWNFIMNCLAGFMNIMPSNSQSTITWMPNQSAKESSLHSFVPLDPDYHPLYPEPLPHSEVAQLRATGSKQLVELFNNSMDRYVEEFAFRNYVHQQTEPFPQPTSLSAPPHLIPTLLPTFNKSADMYEKERAALKEALVAYFLAFTNPIAMKNVTDELASVPIHFALLCVHAPFQPISPPTSERIPFYTHPIFIPQVCTDQVHFDRLVSCITSPIQPAIIRPHRSLETFDPYVFVDSFFALAPFFPADGLDVPFSDLQSSPTSYIQLFRVFVRVIIAVLEENNHPPLNMDVKAFQKKLLNHESWSIFRPSPNYRMLINDKEDIQLDSSRTINPFPHPQLTIITGSPDDRKEILSEMRLSRELTLHCSSVPTPQSIVNPSQMISGQIQPFCTIDEIHKRDWSPAITNILDYTLQKTLDSIRSHGEQDRYHGMYALDVLIDLYPWEYLLLHEKRIVETLLESFAQYETLLPPEITLSNSQIPSPFSETSDLIIDECGLPDVFELNTNVPAPSILQPITLDQPLHQHPKRKLPLPFIRSESHTNTTLITLLRSIVIRCHPAPLFPTTFTISLEQCHVPESLGTVIGCGHLPHLLSLISITETIISYLHSEQKATRQAALSVLNLLSSLWVTSVERVLKLEDPNRAPVTKDLRRKGMTALFSLPSLNTLRQALHLSGEQLTHNDEDTQPQCLSDIYFDHIFTPINEHTSLKVCFARLFNFGFMLKATNIVLSSEHISAILDFLSQIMIRFGQTVSGKQLFRCISIDCDLKQLQSNPELKAVFDSPFSEADVDKQLQQAVVTLYKQDLIEYLRIIITLLKKLFKHPAITEDQLVHLLTLSCPFISIAKGIPVLFEPSTDFSIEALTSVGLKLLSKIASIKIPPAFHTFLHDTAREILVAYMKPSLPTEAIAALPRSLFFLSRTHMIQLALKEKLIQITDKMQVHLFNSFVVGLRLGNMDFVACILNLFSLIPTPNQTVVRSIASHLRDLFVQVPLLFIDTPLFTVLDDQNGAVEEQSAIIQKNQSELDPLGHVPTHMFIKQFDKPSTLSPSPFTDHFSIPIFSQTFLPLQIASEFIPNIFVRSSFVASVVHFSNTHSELLAELFSDQRESQEVNALLIQLIQHPDASKLRTSIIKMITDDYLNPALPTDQECDPNVFVDTLIKLATTTERHQKASYINHSRVVRSKSHLVKITTEEEVPSQSPDVFSQTSQPPTQLAVEPSTTPEPEEPTEPFVEPPTRGRGRGRRGRFGSDSRMSSQRKTLTDQPKDGSSTLSQDQMGTVSKFLKLKDSFVLPLQHRKWSPSSSSQLDFSTLCIDIIVSSAVPLDSPFLSTITHTDLLASSPPDIHAGFLSKAGLILKLFISSPQEVVRSTTLIKCINSLFATFSDLYHHSPFYLISALSPSVISVLMQLPAVLMHFLRALNSDDLVMDEEMNQPIVGAFQSLASLLNLHSEINFSDIAQFLLYEVPVTFKTAFRIRILKLLFPQLSRPDATRTLPLLKFVTIPIASTMAEQKMKRIFSGKELSLIQEVIAIPSDSRESQPTSLIARYHDNFILRSSKFIFQYEAGDVTERDQMGSIYQTLFLNIPIREAVFSFFSYIVRIFPSIAEPTSSLLHLIKKNISRHPSFAGYQVILSESIALGSHHSDFLSSLETLIQSEPPKHLLQQYLCVLPFSPSLARQHLDDLRRNCLATHPSDTIFEYVSQIQIENYKYPSLCSSAVLMYAISHFNYSISNIPSEGEELKPDYECSWIGNMNTLIDLLTASNSSDSIEIFTAAFPQPQLLLLEPTFFDKCLALLDQNNQFNSTDTKDTKDHLVSMRLCLIQLLLSAIKQLDTRFNSLNVPPEWNLLKSDSVTSGKIAKPLENHFKLARKAFVETAESSNRQIHKLIQHFIQTLKLFNEIDPPSRTQAVMYQNEVIKQIGSDIFFSTYKYTPYLYQFDATHREFTGNTQTLVLSFVSSSIQRLVEEYTKSTENVDFSVSHLSHLFDSFRRTLDVNIPNDDMSDNIWKATTSMMKQIEVKLRDFVALKEKLVELAKITIHNSQNTLMSSDFPIQRRLYFVCWVASLDSSIWPEMDRVYSDVISTVLSIDQPFAHDIAKYYLAATIRRHNLTPDQMDKVARQVRIHIKDGVKLPDPKRPDLRLDTDPTYHHLLRVIEVLSESSSTFEKTPKDKLSSEAVKVQFVRLELLYEAKKKEYVFLSQMGKRCNLNSYNNALFKVYSAYLQMPCPEDFDKSSSVSGNDILGEDTDPLTLPHFVKPLPIKASSAQFYQQTIGMYIQTFSTGDIRMRMNVISLLHNCLPQDLTKRIEFCNLVLDWTSVMPYRGITLTTILLMSLFSEPLSPDNIVKQLRQTPTPIKFAVHTPRLEGWSDFMGSSEQPSARSNPVSSLLFQVDELFLQQLARSTNHTFLISTLYSLMFASESFSNSVVMNFIPALWNHLSDDEQWIISSGFVRILSTDVEMDPMPPILFGSHLSAINSSLRLAYLCRLQPYTANSPLSMIRGKHEHFPIHTQLEKDLPYLICLPPRRGLSSHLPFTVQSPFWNLVPFVTDTHVAYHPVTLTHEISPAVMITSFSLGNLRSRRILMHLLHRLRGCRVGDQRNNPEENVPSLIDSFDTILKLTAGLIQEIPQEEKQSPLPIARHTPTHLSTHLNTIREISSHQTTQKPSSDNVNTIPVVSKTWISPLYPYALPQPLWSTAQNEARQIFHQFSSEQALQSNHSLFSVYFPTKNPNPDKKGETGILSGAELMRSLVSIEKQLKVMNLPKLEPIKPRKPASYATPPHSQTVPVVPSPPALLIPAPIVIRAANELFLQEAVIAYLQLSISEIQANERTFRRGGETRVPISSHHLSDAHYSQTHLTKSGMRIPIVMKSGFERRIDQYNSIHQGIHEKNDPVDINSLFDLSDEQIWGPDGKKPDLRCDLDCLDGDEWFDGEMDDLSDEEADFVFDLASSTSTLLFTDSTVNNKPVESPSKIEDSPNHAVRPCDTHFSLDLTLDTHRPSNIEVSRLKAEPILFQSLLYPRTTNLTIKPNMAIHEIRVKQFHPPEPFSLMGASYKTNQDLLSEVYSMTNNIGLLLAHFRSHPTLPSHSRLVSFISHGYHRQYVQEFAIHHHASLPPEFTREQYDLVTHNPTRLPKTLQPPISEGEFYDLDYVPTIEERLSYPFTPATPEIKNVMREMASGPDVGISLPPNLGPTIGGSDIYGGALKLLDPAYIPVIPTPSEYRVLEMMNTFATKHTMEYSSLHDTLHFILRVGPEQPTLQTFTELSWKLGPSQYIQTQRFLRSIVDDPSRICYGPKYLHSSVFSRLLVLVNQEVPESTRVDALNSMKELAKTNGRWLQHTFSLGSSLSYSDLTMYASRYIDLMEFIEFSEEANQLQPRNVKVDRVHGLVEEKFNRLVHSFLLRPLGFTSQSTAWTDSVLFRAYLLDSCLLVDLPPDLRYKAISPLFSQTAMFLKKYGHNQDSVTPSIALGSLPSYFVGSRFQPTPVDNARLPVIPPLDQRYIPSVTAEQHAATFSEYDKLMLIDIYRHRSNFSAAIDTIRPRKIGPRVNRPPIAVSDRFVSHFSLPEEEPALGASINTIHTIREPNNHLAIGDRSALYVSLALRAATIALASNDSDSDRLWEQVHLLLGNTTLAHERAFLSLEKDSTDWKNWEMLSQVLTKALYDKWNDEYASGYGGRKQNTLNLFSFPPFSLAYAPNVILSKSNMEEIPEELNALNPNDIFIANNVYANDALSSLTLALFSVVLLHPSSAPTYLSQFLISLQRHVVNNRKVDVSLTNSMKRGGSPGVVQTNQRRITSFTWIPHLFYLFNQLPTISRNLLKGVLLDVVEDFPETTFFALSSFIFTQKDYRVVDHQFSKLILAASIPNEGVDRSLSPSARLALIPAAGIHHFYTLSTRNRSLLSMPDDLIHRFIALKPNKSANQPVTTSAISSADARSLWNTMQTKYSDLSRMYETLVNTLSSINLDSTHLIVNSIDVLIHLWLSAFNLATAVKDRNGHVENLPEHLQDLAENRHMSEVHSDRILSLDVCHLHVILLNKFIFTQRENLPSSFYKFATLLPDLFSVQPSLAPTASLVIALQYLCSWRDVLFDACPKTVPLFSYSPTLFRLCPALKKAGVSMPGASMFLSPSSVSPHSLSVLSDKVTELMGHQCQQSQKPQNPATIIQTIHSTIMFKSRCSPFSLYLDVAPLLSLSEDEQHSFRPNTFVPLTVPLLTPLVTFVSQINSLHTFALYSTWFHSKAAKAKNPDFRFPQTSALILPELHSVISIVPSQSSFFLPSLAAMVSQPLANTIIRSPTASQSLLHVNTQAITGLHSHTPSHQFLSKPMQGGSKKDLIPSGEPKQTQNDEALQPGLVCGGQFSEARGLNRSGNRTDLRASNISFGTVPVAVPFCNDLIGLRDLPEGVTMHELMREWGRKIRTTVIPMIPPTKTDDHDLTMKNLCELLPDQTSDTLQDLQNATRTEYHSMGIPKNDDVQIRYVLSLRGISLRTLFSPQNPKIDDLSHPIYRIPTSKQTRITTKEIPICCKEHALHPSLLKAKMRMSQDVLSAAIHRRLPTIEFFQPAMRSMATQMGIGSFITYLCSFTPAHPGALVLYPETGNCVQTVWNWDERWGFGEDEISTNEWWKMGVNYPIIRDVCRPGTFEEQPEKPYSPVRIRCTPSLLRLFGDDILGACYVKSFTQSADCLTDPISQNSIQASLTEFFTIALDSIYRTHPSPPVDIQNTFDSITKACLGELTFKDTFLPTVPDKVAALLRVSDKTPISPTEALHWTASNLSRVAFSRSLILNTAEQLKRDILKPVDTSSYLVIHSALHPDYLSQLPWWWFPWF
ncbi:hypothetical protein BLNAU_5652 [Blattamonas nauphoetae]|uniref:Uncharacterized protein n=1 Tax=Blattamonas nauphoetae TaxID=2049346 RepID=A0ABQ9Y6J3_9EUKA|nr:hypothetical protein BLNAU_5652 [Blattamonas nauphoetae]